MATNTIRERIILAVIAKLADIRTGKGYNTEAGLYVNRAVTHPDWDKTPFLTIYPQAETATQDYGSCMCHMQIMIQAIMAHGATNPSVIAEQLLGDMIECMTGIKYTLAFTSGGTVVPVVGNTITGHTSSATAYIQAITVTGGSWGAGTASGTFTLRRVTGTFQAENLDIGANLNVATIAGPPISSLPIVTTAGGLADRVLYVSGGPEQYPDTDETETGCSALFQLDYRIISGDPYHQP